MEHENGRWRRRAPEICGIFGLAAAAALAFIQSYRKWIDPIIDIGRDLYIPGRLLEGVKLYADVRYNYPPVAPYLLAILTAPRDDLTAYTAIGVATAAGVSLLLYGMVRLSAGRMAAFCATLLFISLSFTGASTFGANFVFPYSHAATFGLLFTLAYSYFGLRAIVHRRPPDVWLTSGFALLAAWTKLEFTFVVAISFPLLFLVYRLPLRAFVATVLTGAASFAAVSVVFTAPAGRHWLFDNVVAGQLLSGRTASEFYAQVTGRALWRSLLPEIALAALLLALGVLLLAGVDRLNSRSRLLRTGGIALLLLAFAFTIALLTAPSGTAPPLTGSRFFRAWTLLQPLLLPFAWRERGSSALAFLLAISLASTARIWLNVAPVWYGFAFIVPLYALASWILFAWLPRHRLYGRRTAWLWLPLFLAIAAYGLTEQRRNYEVKRYRIDTPKGWFYDYLPGRASTVEEFTRWMRQQREETLVVFPEGITLNYFTDTINPISYYLFTPVETSDPVIEQRIIDELARENPAFVVLLDRPVAEFGFVGFGVDYHTALLRHLQQNYRPVHRWDSDRFWLLVLAREGVETVE